MVLCFGINSENKKLKAGLLGTIEINHLAASSRGIKAAQYSFISLQAAGNKTLDPDKLHFRDQFVFILFIRLQL